MVSNDREKEKVWIWADMELGRFWEKLGEGNCNQNIFYKLFSI